MEQNRLPSGWKSALDGLQRSRAFWGPVLFLSAFGMALGIQGVRDQTWIGDPAMTGTGARLLSGAFALGMLGSAFQAIVRFGNPQR